MCTGGSSDQWSYSEPASGGGSLDWSGPLGVWALFVAMWLVTVGPNMLVSYLS